MDENPKLSPYLRIRLNLLMVFWSFHVINETLRFICILFLLQPTVRPPTRPSRQPPCPATARPPMTSSKLLTTSPASSSLLLCPSSSSFLLILQPSHMAFFYGGFLAKCHEPPYVIDNTRPNMENFVGTRWRMGNETRILGSEMVNWRRRMRRNTQLIVYHGDIEGDEMERGNGTNKVVRREIDREGGMESDFVAGTSTHDGNKFTWEKTACWWVLKGSWLVGLKQLLSL